LEFDSALNGLTVKSSRTKLLLGLLVLGPVIWGLLWYRGEGKLIPLPIYSDTEMDGSETPWVIRDFSLLDQDSNVVTLADLKGKIVIANFFYATCPNICPRMNKEINYLASKFSNNPNIILVSHSVNPEYDTVPVMKDYALQFNFPTEKWRFLTGKKSEVYDLAENYYKAVAVKADGPDDFIHTTTVVLLDKESRIRGFFESIDNSRFNRDLKGAIQALIKEYKIQDGQG